METLRIFVTWSFLWTILATAALAAVATVLPAGLYSALLDSPNFPASDPDREARLLQWREDKRAALLRTVAVVVVLAVLVRAGLWLAQH